MASTESCQRRLLVLDMEHERAGSCVRRSPTSIPLGLHASTHRLASYNAASQEKILRCAQVSYQHRALGGTGSIVQSHASSFSPYEMLIVGRYRSYLHESSLDRNTEYKSRLIFLAPLPPDVALLCETQSSVSVECDCPAPSLMRSSDLLSTQSSISSLCSNMGGYPPSYPATRCQPSSLHSRELSTQQQFPSQR